MITTVHGRVPVVQLHLLDLDYLQKNEESREPIHEPLSLKKQEIVGQNMMRTCEDQT